MRIGLSLGRGLGPGAALRLKHGLGVSQTFTRDKLSSETQEAVTEVT